MSRKFVTRSQYLRDTIFSKSSWKYNFLKIFEKIKRNLELFEILTSQILELNCNAFHEKKFGERVLNGHRFHVLIPCSFDYILAPEIRKEKVKIQAVQFQTTKTEKFWSCYSIALWANGFLRKSQYCFFQAVHLKIEFSLSISMLPSCYLFFLLINLRNIPYSTYPLPLLMASFRI